MKVKYQTDRDVPGLSEVATLAIQLLHDATKAKGMPLDEVSKSVLDIVSQLDCLDAEFEVED